MTGVLIWPIVVWLGARPGALWPRILVWPVAIALVIFLFGFALAFYHGRNLPLALVPLSYAVVFVEVEVFYAIGVLAGAMVRRRQAGKPAVERESER